MMTQQQAQAQAPLASPLAHTFEYHFFTMGSESLWSQFCCCCKMPTTWMA